MKNPENTNSLVVRANRLLEAKYRLTATEQKLIHMVMAMICKDDEDFRTFILKISDFVQLIDTKNNNKYAQVKVVSKNLMKKVFTIYDLEKDEEIQVTWFSGVKYNHKKGFVEFEFSSFLKPYLLQLKSCFTKVNIERVMQLRSGYSLRIYDLLKQYESIGRRQFKLLEFRELLGIPKDEYRKYADLKINVISRAYREINAKTDIMFEFEELKEGKKVTALMFAILSKSKAIVIEPEPPTLPGTTSVNQNDIQAVKVEFKRLYGGELVDRFVSQMIAKKGLEHLIECVQTYKDYIGGRNIKNGFSGISRGTLFS